MAKIKGITVVLETTIQNGYDGFNRPVYVSDTTEVDNVLVGEPSTEEVNEVLQIHGKQLRYVLAVPKEDGNDWTDKKVTFFGKTFRTLGEPTQGIVENIPLEWNKKIRVVNEE